MTQAVWNYIKSSVYGRLCTSKFATEQSSSRAPLFQKEKHLISLITRWPLPPSGMLFACVPFLYMQ